MNIIHLRVIFTKDWKELIKSKQALIPMIAVPLLLVILLPAILLIVISSGSAEAIQNSGMEKVLDKLPAKLIPFDYDESQKMIYTSVVYFFGPIFLLIPVMFTSIIASHSFSGEKERKTIEGLLYTPVSDRTLVLGKILVAWIPSLGITLLCFLLYTVIVNAFASPVMKGLYFPTKAWIVMIFWLVPAISFLSLAIVVAVSQRAAGIWEAQQISVLMILPIVGLILSQTTGLFFLNTPIIFTAGLVLFGADYLLYRWIIKTFDRERMVTHLT